MSQIPPTSQLTYDNCVAFFADGYTVDQISVDPPVPTDLTTADLLWAYWCAQLVARQLEIQVEIYELLGAFGGG